MYCNASTGVARNLRRHHTALSRLRHLELGGSQVYLLPACISSLQALTALHLPNSSTWWFGPEGYTVRLLATLGQMPNMRSLHISSHQCQPLLTQLTHLSELRVTHLRSEAEAQPIIAAFGHRAGMKVCLKGPARPG